METNISPMSSDFEQIKKSTEDGQEYWSSRELSTALGIVPIRRQTSFKNCNYIKK